MYQSAKAFSLTAKNFWCSFLLKWVRFFGEKKLNYTVFIHYQVFAKNLKWVRLVIYNFCEVQGRTMVLSSYARRNFKIQLQFSRN